MICMPTMARKPAQGNRLIIQAFELHAQPGLKSFQPLEVSTTQPTISRKNLGSSKPFVTFARWKRSQRVRSASKELEVQKNGLTSCSIISNILKHVPGMRISALNSTMSFLCPPCFSVTSPAVNGLGSKLKPKRPTRGAQRNLLYETAFRSASRCSSSELRGGGISMEHGGQRCFSMERGGQHGSPLWILTFMGMSAPLVLEKNWRRRTKQFKQLMYAS